MVDVSVSLPAELQRYVDSRVAAGGFSNPADFLRSLVQRDRDLYREDLSRVQQLIREGIESGVVDGDIDDIIDEIVADLRTGHG